MNKTLPPSFVRRCGLWGVWLVLLWVSCSQKPKEVADLIYIDGSILTMESDRPEYIESLAIRNGKILFAGSSIKALRYAGSNTQLVNLKKKFMMPGFVDSHGHLLYFACLQSSIDVKPPSPGRGISHTQLLDTLKYVFTYQRPAFLLATSDDEGIFSSVETRYPTRVELDMISKDIPIVVLDHTIRKGVANTKALELAGVLNKNFTEPPGGKFLKDDKGRWTGFFEGTAMYEVLSILPLLSSETFYPALQKAMEYYLSGGITTAQEGYALEQHYHLLQSAASDEQLPLDIIAYLKWSDFDMLNKKEKLKPGLYQERFKLGGVKIILEESIPFISPLEDRKLPKASSDAKNVANYNHMTFDRLNTLIGKYHENNVQTVVECRDEVAADWMIEAMKNAEKNKGKRDLRYSVVHTGLLREDQLEAFRNHGIYPTFFISSDNLINRQESLLKRKGTSNGITPLQSAMKRKNVFGIHSDVPLTGNGPLFTIQSAVSGKSNSGIALDENQQVDVYTALKAATLWGAYMYREENKKGSIKEGKMADLIILTDDPLKVPPEKIGQIRVLETIKEGKSVFKFRKLAK